MTKSRSEARRTLAAGRIIDIMMGDKFDWRARLSDSDFLESADWLTALAYADAAFTEPAAAMPAREEIALESPSGPYVMSEAAKAKIAKLRAKPSASGHVRFGSGSTSGGGPGAWIETDAGITVSEHMLQSAVASTEGEWMRPMLQAFAEVLPRYVATLSHELSWQDMQSAPRDGTDILLFHEHHGIIQGHFAPGEWSEDTPISPAEYSGAVWVLGDDLHQEEVEELPEGAPLGLRFYDGNLIGWKPLSALTPNDGGRDDA